MQTVLSVCLVPMSGGTYVTVAAQMVHNPEKMRG